MGITQEPLTSLNYFLKDGYKPPSAMATEGRKEGKYSWDPASSTKDINLRKKYSNWFVTSWGPEDNEKLCADEFPTWVRKVVGGMEQADPSPDSPDPKPHFQGLINTHSVQFSQVKKWLPKAHFEIPRNLEAAHNYCLKAKTAVGPKLVKENPAEIGYLEAHELAILLAGTVESDESDHFLKYAEMRLKTPYARYLYEIAFNRVLKKHGNHLFSSLMNPSFESGWCKTYTHWLSEARAAKTVVLEVVAHEPGHSITPGSD